MRERENTWLGDKQPSTHEAEQQKARGGFPPRRETRDVCEAHSSWGGGAIGRGGGVRLHGPRKGVEVSKLARISADQGSRTEVGGHRAAI